jgi:peptide chain release factor 2
VRFRRASSQSGGVFDLLGKAQEAEQLEARSAAPDLWDEPQRAQSLLQRLTALRNELERWQQTSDGIAALDEMLTLAEAENDDSLAGDLRAELKRVTDEVERLEFEVLLSGAYNDRDAFLTVHAGSGGVDAQDWAEMLLRMYSRWAALRGFTTTLVDQTDGEEAGIKTATLELRGPYAYGYARAESGVHRLVRLSPFDQAHRRHTSFALVEVLPEVDDAPEVQISPDDLRVDVFRAGGHGGQGVNTTDSAVRLVYKGGTPDEIVVTCQNERSQLQNKETALRVLRGKLLERELQRQAEERARLKGEHRKAEFGSQIRSYVLHPYTMVKDHRTEAETSNAQAVLDGELDPLIEAWLKWNVGRESAA